MRVSFIIGLLFFSLSTAWGQSEFHLTNHKQQVVIPFKLINNLVFIPIKVNGEELTFLLDTGVEETILFSLDDQEQIKFFQVEKIKLKGLGSKEAIDAYQSSKNTLDANGYSDENHVLYLVLDQEFNFSSQVGIPVNGIIGYQFFKNHKVEINYERRKVIVYAETSKKIIKKLERKYVANPIRLEEKKPYCFSTIELNGKVVNSKLLVDTGNSDALWVFLHVAKEFRKPEQTVHDFLGRGFSGEIYGLRGRVSRFDFGQKTFEHPISTFPDSVAVQSVSFVPNRIGSIGGEVLSRFDLVFDYPHQVLYTRPNRKIDEPFNYNMSGIEVEHAGLEWSKEFDDSRNQDIKVYSSASDERVQHNLSLHFVLKPVFTIAIVREGSAAQLAGLKKGDRIISINGRFAHQFTIGHINEMLKSEEGRTIKMEIERNGVSMEFKFELKSIL
jgi:hypothetical protein